MTDSLPPQLSPHPRILIVDDSELRIRQLRQILSTAGYPVVGEAEDGSQAIVEFQRLQPDIVIMDLIMPRMNGLDAMQAILDSAPQVAIVIASSMRSAETALECHRAGARFYLHKPFDPETVRTVLQKLIAK